MEGDFKAINPNYQEELPPQMPDPAQQPPPAYAQVVATPAYQQPYYPNQFTPLSQPVVYQPAQYVVTTTAPPLVLQPVYSDYMCWSVISMLFCCLPIGLAALIFSCKTQDAIARRDLYKARSHSSTARGLNIFALMFGIFSYISMTIFMIFRF